MQLITGKLRERLKRARDESNRALYRYGSHGFHYRFVRNVFSRETSAVFHGIREHHRKTQAGSEIFELRRRIHMIEKGLTMRPRRDKFATGYILELLERLDRSLRLGVLGDETIAWARDVLDGYMEATATSTSDIIARARTAYAQIPLESAIPYCGPALPVAPPIDFDPGRLEALAQHRRSVRWYQDRPVDRAVVDRAVEIALQSPTACNRVPYQVRIFDNPADARRVAQIAGGTTGYVQNLQSVAVIVGDLSAYQDERDRHLIYIDGSLAAMGFVYALEASGVSSCCINWPDMKAPERAMRELISLEPYERVVMLVAFGYGDPDGLAPASPKLSLEQVRSYRHLEAHV